VWGWRRRRPARPESARPALAVVGAAATRGIRTLGPAVATALTTGVARGATLRVDTPEVLAVVAGRASLPVGAVVRAVPVTSRAAAAAIRACPALAIVVAGARTGVRARDAAVAATAVVEIAWRTAFLADALLELSARCVIDAFLGRRGARRRQDAESKHQDEEDAPPWSNHDRHPRRHRLGAAAPAYVPARRLSKRVTISCDHLFIAFSASPHCHCAAVSIDPPPTRRSTPAASTCPETESVATNSPCA
jgi:hypothetical protein